MNHNEIEISLTQFVDFILKTGTPRLTEVRRIKSQHKSGYHPSRDFYRKLRDGIVEYHEYNRERTFFNNLSRGITDRNKLSIYPELINAYKKFLGRKDVAWFDQAKDFWNYKELRVSINPELGLTLNDNKYLIKLYFKEEPKLTKQRIRIISNLMDTLDRPDDVQLAILELRRGKFHELGYPDDDMLPLLHGDADAFITMYRDITV